MKSKVYLSVLLVFVVAACNPETEIGRGNTVGDEAPTGVGQPPAPEPSPVENPVAEKVDFNSQIKSIFTENCVSCHNGTFKFDASDQASSEAIKLKIHEEVSEGKMPPSGALEAEEVDLIRRWATQ